MITNKDQVKGALKDIGGEIQEEAGKLVGSTKQQIKGLKNQAKGKIQKGAGDLKEAVSDVREAAKKWRTGWARNNLGRRCTRCPIESIPPPISGRPKLQARKTESGRCGAGLLAP